MCSLYFTISRKPRNSQLLETRKSYGNKFPKIYYTDYIDRQLNNSNIVILHSGLFSRGVYFSNFEIAAIQGINFH